MLGKWVGGVGWVLVLVFYVFVVVWYIYIFVMVSRWVEGFVLFFDFRFVYWFGFG